MPDQDLEGRMARLEATVEAFVTTVRSQFDNTSEQFEVLYKHIDGLRDAIQQRDRTPWANLIAAGALFLAVIAMVAQGYIRDLSRVQGTQDKALDAFLSHVSDGHPGTINAKMNAALAHIRDDDAKVDAWIQVHDKRELDLYHTLLKEHKNARQ